MRKAGTAASGIRRPHRLSARSPAPRRISQPASRLPGTLASDTIAVAAPAAASAVARASTRNVGSSAITTTPIRPRQPKAAASARSGRSPDHAARFRIRPFGLVRRNRHRHEHQRDRRQDPDQAEPAAPSDRGGGRPPANALIARPTGTKVPQIASAVAWSAPRLRRTIKVGAATTTSR